MALNVKKGILTLLGDLVVGDGVMGAGEGLFDGAIDGGNTGDSMMDGDELGTRSTSKTSYISNRLSKFLRNGNTWSISDSSTPINCPTAFHMCSQLVVGNTLPREIISLPFFVISFGYSPTICPPLIPPPAMK